MTAIRDMWAEGFHVYWRKGSDSKYSVVIWNLIHVIPREVWGSFCDHMASEIGDTECSSISAAQIARAIKRWDGLPPETRGEPVYFCRSFKALLELMDNDELSGLEAWFQQIA